MKLKQYLLFAFIGAITFLSCSDSNNDDTKPEEEKVIALRSCYFKSATDADGNYPFSVVGFAYNWDALSENITGVYCSSFPSSTEKPYSIDRQENKIVMIRHTPNGPNEMYHDTLNITLQNNRIVELVTGFNVIFLDEEVQAANKDRFYDKTISKFFYNAAGFLERKTYSSRGDYEYDQLKNTIKNGNIVKSEFYQPTNTAEFNIRTYTYTYDQSEYTAMSDWTLYTPLDHVSHGGMYPIFDQIVGKKNKNNVTKVDIDYGTPEWRWEGEYLYFTLTPVIENGCLVKIKHKGRVKGSPDHEYEDFDFDNMETQFIYAPVDEELTH